MSRRLYTDGMQGAFGIGNKYSKKGWGTVYPFSFTTTTASAVQSKAWVIKGQGTTAVTKRDVDRATTTGASPPVETMFVTGDERLDAPWFNLVDDPKQLNTDRSISQARGESRVTPYDAVRTAEPAPQAPRYDSSASSPPKSRTRPHHVARIPQALEPRQSDCNLEFDKEGYEDVEVGDSPYFDPPLPEEETTPKCSPSDILQADVEANSAYLSGLGDDGYPPNNCCGGGPISCQQLVVNGTATTSLCGGKEEGCIGCAMVANYVTGICGGCTKDKKCGGQQDINEVSGLRVEISLSTRGRSPSI